MKPTVYPPVLRLTLPVLGILIPLTIAGNRAPTALHAESSDSGRMPVEIGLTNTLISSATHAYVGLARSGAVTATHTNSLLHNVAVQHTSQQGTPVFNSQNLLNDDPKLDSQYRLLSGSDAIDQGAGSDYILVPGPQLCRWGDQPRVHHRHRGRSA